MVQSVQEITSKLSIKPPEPMVKVFKSGVVTEEEINKFCLWMDRLIRTGETKEQREKNANELLNKIFSEDEAKKIAGKIRAFGDSEKQLINYIKLDKPIVFFSIKTVGQDTDEHRIKELSLIKYYQDGKNEAWSQEFNPELLEKNDEKDKTLPTFKDSAKTVYTYINSSHLGGFDILPFQIKVLQKEFERAGIEFKKEGRAILDPLAIYHKKVSKNGSISDLPSAYKQLCKKELQTPIDVGFSVKATVRVLKSLFDNYPDLPQDVYELSRFSGGGNGQLPPVNGKTKFVEGMGMKFKWANDKIYFNFGRHKEKTLEDVIKYDRPYVEEWMLSKEVGFSNEIKELVTNALNGIYPTQPVNGNGKPHIETPKQEEAKATT